MKLRRSVLRSHSVHKARTLLTVTMASEGNQGRDHGRRYRADLQGALQFSSDVREAELQASGEATAAGHLTEERREFLNAALDEMKVDIVGEQKKALHILQDPETDDDLRIAALEQLCELSEDINAACDFHKIGGFPVLEKHFQHTNPEVRWNSCELLAGVVQNNPSCQKAATNVRMMKRLMHLLDNDSVDTVRVKALYALSCLCRDCLDAQTEFCRLDGFSYLMRAMQSGVEKLQVKSAFMLSALATSQPHFKDSLCDMGMVEQLIGLLRSPHTDFHEHVMSALVTIVEGHERAVQACQQPQLEFREFLKERIKEIDGKEEFEEEKFYSEQLLKMCFSRPQSSGEER